MTEQRRRTLVVAGWLVLAVPAGSWGAPPRMRIFHFDVNTGDATLVISPDGRGALIDAGDRGESAEHIVRFLDRARRDGILTSLEFTVATHYDADHIGGMDQVFAGGWYPRQAALDRGSSLLPRFDRDYVEESCDGIDVERAEGIAAWGTAPEDSCPGWASCQILEYFLTAEDGGRRKTIQPGDVLTLDHGIELVALVVNARDIDGDTVDVHVPGRRDDCGSNYLSVGVLVKYGDFRYLVAGDLTGDPGQDVADVEELIRDDAADVDVYHVNHHGSETSSSPGFMAAIRPTVAIVSNGGAHGHPRRTVIEERIFGVSPRPAVFLTNRNPQDSAWKEDEEVISDLDLFGFDGMVEIQVWQRSYRVFIWRNGTAVTPGTRFLIKER